MAIRVSKKILVILAIIVFLALSAAAGFIAWRLTQDKDVTPEESEAFEFVCNTCSSGECTWCGDSTSPNCACSNYDVSGCLVHEGSGCVWMDDTCQCKPYGGTCAIATSRTENTINIQCLSSDSGSCKASVAECFEDMEEDGQSACESTLFVPCTPETVEISVGETLAITVPDDCGAWQLDAYSCGEHINPLVGCNWSDSCGAEEEPTCGDGVCDKGEKCEYILVGYPEVFTCPEEESMPLSSANYCREESQFPGSGCTYCGDGVKNGNEECDGSSGTCPSGSSCLTSCTCSVPPTCGDGKCDTNETCDPAGTAADIACGGRSLPSGVSCRTEGIGACTFCGDGVRQTQLGETAEECDPPSGSSWQCESGVCQDNCKCQEQSPEYLTVQGEVYCQDPNGVKYPVEGATIVFSKESGSETLVTGANGQYSSQVNVTRGEQEPFSVRYSGLADSSNELPTGVEYSDMEGPEVDSPSICSTGKCSTCGSDYSGCYGLEEGSNEGFDWVFSHCSPEEIIPGWSIEKTNTVTCVDEDTVNAHADINYTIKVRNITEGGTVLSVTDTFDSRITAGSISRIVPAGGVVSSGSLLWNSGYEFSQGEEKTFTYTVRVPMDLFGSSLDNHVVAVLDVSDGVPENASELNAYSSALVVCEKYEPPLPGTGLFDSTVARVVLGFVCVLIGYGYYHFGLLDGVMNWVTRSSEQMAGKVRYSASSEGRRDRWERRVVVRAEKSRKRAA